MSEIQLAREPGGVVVVTLNRPERRNCLTLALWRQLAELYRGFAHDPEVRCVILTGAGGQFCAGADISEFPKVRATPEQAEAYAEAVDEANDAMLDLPQPTIAAIAGYCVGGGCGLAVANDFRIAESNAIFSVPAARLGIVYGVKETRNLLNVVGLTNAKRILFAAERLPAGQAQEMGLVDDLVEIDALASARELAGRLARNAPLSIAGAKAILGQLSDGTGELDEAVIDAVQRRAMESEDYREAVQAFAEKRQPRFQGR
ncbi:enoyl-CoA hydratase-related protein [Aquibaculum sediminis]|uniref:enoyl-CoA hydratase-related protein n=1 Tax=Aquibaculum sediminis TaxID=3231907 RepID=UPI003454D95D